MASFLMFEGARRIPSAEVALIGTLETPLAFVLEFFFDFGRGFSIRHTGWWRNHFRIRALGAGPRVQGIGRIAPWGRLA